MGPSRRNRSVEIFGEFLEPIWTVRDCVGAVGGVCIIIYIINCLILPINARTYTRCDGYGNYMHGVMRMEKG